MTIVAEKCNEYNMPLWVATLDFKKAFDSIEHSSIWDSLLEHGASPVSVDVLSRLYQGQRGSVKSAARSREFDISRGTKQGDPISPIIFNCVLEDIMRKIKTKLGVRKYGVQLGYGPAPMVTNLRFADDNLLVGRSLPQVKQMLADVAREGARVGLQLHPAKTKIQHNDIGYGSRARKTKVADMEIEVLDPSAHAMYLGRALSLTDTHDAELRHRIRKAWSKFGTFRGELTDRAVPLHLRLRLFHAVLTPTILYGCASWVMTESRSTLLRTTQLKMLRVLLGRGRIRKEPDGAVETWVEWVQRVTPEARKAMLDHGIPAWDVEQQSRQRQWGLHVESMSHDRWAKKALNWQPDGRRGRGRPATRWADKFASLIAEP